MAGDLLAYEAAQAQRVQRPTDLSGNRGTSVTTTMTIYAHALEAASWPWASTRSTGSLG
jgi:hypothetical protein